MSHVVQMKFHVLDVDALEAAVSEMGAEFRKGKQNYEWYGRTAEAKCAHAIGLPGVRYEIGVVPHASGNGYDLAFDPYGYSSNARHDGHKLSAHFGGDKLARLRQAYAAEVNVRAVSRMGYRVQRIRQQDGSVRITASR